MTTYFQLERNANMNSSKANIVKVSLLVCLSIFLTGCHNHNGGGGGGVYPPSQYVGLWGQYHGYQNGQLPSKTRNFTGHWSYAAKDGTKIEGWYKNGIPRGMWRHILGNGLIDSVSIYDENNNYLSITYYPDGVQRSVTAGMSVFGNGKWQTSISSSISYDPDGRIVESGNEKWTKRVSGAADFKKDGALMVCHFEMSHDGNKDFSYMVFVYPKNKRSGDFGKVQLNATLDSKKGRISNVDEKVYYGNYRLKISFKDSHNSPILALVSQDEATPLFVLPPMKPN